MAANTLFDKAANVIKKLQSSEWQPDDKNRHQFVASIDLSRYASTIQEAQFLCHIVNMILGQIPNANCIATQISITFPGEKYATYRGVHEPSEARIAICHLHFNKKPTEALREFQEDKSLSREQQPRTMTANFKPNNLRQMLDFARWKESTRWAQAKTNDGYYYGMCYSHGVPSGMMFYVKSHVEMVNWHLHYTRSTPPPAEPEDWVCRQDRTMRYPDSMAIPQIYTARDDLMVRAQDAKELLVDFIGLDANILGVNKGMGKTT